MRATALYTHRMASQGPARRTAPKRPPASVDWPVQDQVGDYFYVCLLFAVVQGAALGAILALIAHSPLLVFVFLAVGLWFTTFVGFG